VVEHPDDWVLPGRDLGNSRTAGDSPITGANVERLGPVWEAELGGQLSTVPLIVGDTVYAQDGTGTIVAVDAATGAQRWRSEPSGFNIGPFGVAVADGRVFGVHGSTGVVALDAVDGAELWVTEITATLTTGIDIQPVAHDGLLYVSTVPVSTSGIYTGGDRGVIHALDAATGEVSWTFDTVDSEDVWGNPDVNSGGGSWYPPAIDPDRGLVYWGVANPAPFPGTAEFPNGTSRPGPNLYTDSVVALDLGSGEMAWYHQVTPHDILDHDLIHTMLVDLPDGSDIVVTTGKGGEVVGVDPDTGEPRWETAVGLHRNDDLEALDGPTIVAPGTFGGVLTPPAWADGVVYVATVNAPVELRPDATAYFGATMGQMDGEVVAIDATTGAVRWATPVPGDPLGGVTVVNDLVLTTLLAGELVALDRDTGDIVHTVELPGGTNGWMSVAGDTVVVPVGQADPPRLVAYRLR
jgi:outer membrane protein assembly factor BamB